MDDKLDTTLTSPPATYRKLTDSDIEQGLKEMGTKAVEHADGADEKMLSKDTKFSTGKNEAEIKFISDEKKNGDAKVDLGDDLRTGFVGMGKEELMRYANDPFWIRLRWILFILFWLVWVLMLAGAIIIIVAAPKCTAPEPRKWWQQGPLAEIDVKVAEDEGQLQNIKKEGFTGIILEGTDDAYDESNDISLVKRILTFGLNVIIDLRPGNTFRWLNASEHRIEPYADYYIWADQKGRNGSNQPIEPNNWKSLVTEGSAWQYSEIREQFYLAQMGKPDLNFRNQKVIDEFSNILRQWLNIGVSGFRLSGTDRLLVDEALRNEEIGLPASELAASHEDANFYTHKYTRNQEGISTILSQWYRIIRNATDNEGILTITEDIDNLQPYKYNDTLVIDLPSYSEVFNLETRPTSAIHMYKGLENAWSVLENNSWPAWKYKAGTLPDDVLQIVIYLLPGTPIIKVKTNETLPTGLAAQNLRSSPAILYGNFSSFILENNTIFAYTREKSGQPGYLVVCNPTVNNATINVSNITNMAEDVTVAIMSKNYSIDGIKLQSKFSAKEVLISPKSALIMTYVRADPTE